MGCIAEKAKAAWSARVVLVRIATIASESLTTLSGEMAWVCQLRDNGLVIFRV